MQFAITDVRIRRIFSEDNLKAIVSVTIDDCLAIHEIKIIQGTERLFVAMPSRMDENGNYHDISHPIDSATRSDFERIILDAYERYIRLEKILSDDRLLS